MTPEFTVTHGPREGYTFDAPHYTKDEVLKHVAELLEDLEAGDIAKIEVTR